MEDRPQNEGCWAGRFYIESLGAAGGRLELADREAVHASGSRRARTGDIVTLRELLDEIGSDALRFFLLSRSADSQMDLDLDLAVKQSDENPVYYVQYAHARIASILRKAGDLPFEMGDVSLLTSEPEQNLLRALLRLPEVVAQAAANLAPHHLAYYAIDLAGVFHGFYRDCRVVSSDAADREITLARLKLVDAARIVLARTLHLMGMSAPETM